MILPGRIQHLNESETLKGSYVLYWMQSSQRATCNHALEYAIDVANNLKKPLIVYFGLTESYPEANLRHYRFMLEGLNETRILLAKRNIKFVLTVRSPEKGAGELAEDAATVIVDRGYLRIPREWRKTLATVVSSPLIQVESDVIVPVGVASVKEEWSAATFRPKIRQYLDTYLVPLAARTPVLSSLQFDFETESDRSTDDILARLDIDRSVSPVSTYSGGTSTAKKHLSRFLSGAIAIFAEKRNDPNAHALSNMSPYLHFGQISPLDIALHVKGSGNRNADTYLEELIIRRELAVNFVHYSTHYDTYAGIPEWAKRTLDKHANDEREYLYTYREFETAQTHDPYWNAAQNEMVKTGKMHGYMRMYWGKKILEWTETPEDAYRAALLLNNKYELDGRDPNGFTGVAWCFGKHDRAWAERPVFGKVRYMNARGLSRKFDADAYADMVSRIP